MITINIASAGGKSSTWSTFSGAVISRSTSLFYIAVRSGFVLGGTPASTTSFFFTIRTRQGADGNSAAFSKPSRLQATDLYELSRSKPSPGHTSVPFKKHYSWKERSSSSTRTSSGPPTVSNFSEFDSSFIQFKFRAGLSGSRHRRQTRRTRLWRLMFGFSSFEIYL